MINNGQLLFTMNTNPLSLAALCAIGLFTAGCSGDEGSSSSAAASSSSSSGGPPLQGECIVCDPPSNQGPLKNVSLAETSGLTAGAAQSDVFYAHNDSGDSSRFFAFSRSGADLGTLNVDGAKNDDWEDIAKGPCAQGSCLFIGDIGDNLLTRMSYEVYRVAEPSLIQPGEQNIASERISFVYEDGPHDAEVLLVHPLTGVLTIITKVGSGRASIYELPLPLSVGKTFTAKKVGEVAPETGENKWTGGAIHPSATGILLRTHSNLFYYPMKPEQSAASALAGGACPLLVADEKQGEAVTWLPAGDGFMTIGEGVSAQISVAACKAP